MNAGMELSFAAQAALKSFGNPTARQVAVAWELAYEIHLARAPTTDGHCWEYASERADRFWPLYLRR